MAALGVARAGCTDVQLAGLLLQLQRELFVVAAHLTANPRQRQRRRLVPGQSRVIPRMVAALEAAIDALVAERPLRPVFVVPGSSAVEAAVDLARAITRRAERHVIAAREAGRVVGDDVVHYLNRLSTCSTCSRARPPEKPRNRPATTSNFGPTILTISIVFYNQRCDN